MRSIFVPASVDGCKYGKKDTTRNISACECTVSNLQKKTNLASRMPEIRTSNSALLDVLAAHLESRFQLVIINGAR